jgi:hypothetical protein
MKIKQNSMIKTGLLTIVLGALWCVNCNQSLFAADFWVDQADVCVGSSIQAHYWISVDELLYYGLTGENASSVDFYNGNSYVGSAALYYVYYDGYDGYQADYTYTLPTTPAPSDDVPATLGAQDDEDVYAYTWNQEGVTWHVNIVSPNCTPPTLNTGTETIDNIAIDKIVSGSQNDYYHVVGTLNNVKATKTYAKFGSTVQNECSWALSRSISKSFTAWSGSFGLAWGVPLSPAIGVSVAWQPPVESCDLFLGNCPQRNYNLWIGQEWERTATPQSGTFTGTTQEFVMVQSDGVYFPIYGPTNYLTGGVDGSFVLPQSVVDDYEGTYCHNKCCPNITQGN